MNIGLVILAGLCDRASGGSQWLQSKIPGRIHSIIAKLANFVQGAILATACGGNANQIVVAAVVFGLLGRDAFGNGAMQGYAIRRAAGRAPEKIQAGTDLVTKAFPFLWNKPYPAMAIYGLVIVAPTIAATAYWGWLWELAVASAVACPAGLAINEIGYRWWSRLGMAGWEVSELCRGALMAGIAWGVHVAAA